MQIVTLIFIIECPEFYIGNQKFMTLFACNQVFQEDSAPFTAGAGSFPFNPLLSQPVQFQI